MNTVAARPGSSRLAPWMAAQGFLALFLLALLQILNPNATPSAGSGSGSATPR